MILGVLVLMLNAPVDVRLHKLKSRNNCARVIVLRLLLLLPILLTYPNDTINIFHMELESFHNSSGLPVA